MQQVCHFHLLQHGDAVRASDGVRHAILRQAPKGPLKDRASSMLLRVLLPQARMQMLSGWPGHMMAPLNSLRPLQR